MSIVDFISDEDLDFKKLFSAFASAITEKDIAELTPYAKELDTFGKILDILGFVSIAETLLNWNAKEKMATEISIFLQHEDGASYMYHAIVNEDLSFKEYYSGYTGVVIKPDDAMYEFIVE